MLGRKFTLVTDHCPLVYLQNFQNPKGRIARWLLLLSEYDWNIEYRKGSQHGNADGLTRASDEMYTEDEPAEERIDDLLNLGFVLPKCVSSPVQTVAVTLLDDDPPASLLPVQLQPTPVQSQASNVTSPSLTSKLAAASSYYHHCLGLVTDATS